MALISLALLLLSQGRIGSGDTVIPLFVILQEFLLYIL